MEDTRKNIVLLSDGTGNSAARHLRTNVWRLYDALDLHEPHQVAFYHDGVGSQDFIVLKVIGGAFGYGLKRNVLDLYKTLCRSYREGDRIYLFGFSRGAFTVRVLAGMVARCGLQTGILDEAELDRIARVNYFVFRQSFRQTFLSSVYRRARGQARTAEANVSPDIELVGVWDTVDAYGLPIDELAELWDRYLFPIRFPDHDLSEKVRRACHAISLDDQRLTFHPLLWNERDDDGRIEQVWFSGAHADVGGGYAQGSLSLVSLDWMISRVEGAGGEAGGLKFIAEKREAIRYQADWYGKQHDSRAGIAAYYRYKPRDVARLCNDDDLGVHVVRPKVHRSVFERICSNVVPYAPTGLPARYEVAATRKMPIAYESEAEAGRRVEWMNPALDQVFWRRWLYGAQLAVTAVLVASRWVLDWEAGGECVGSACLAEPVLEVARWVLPEAVYPWIDAWSQNPSALWGFVLAFAVLLWLRQRATSRCESFATTAWAHLKRNRGAPVEETAAPVERRFDSAVRRFRERAGSRFRTRLKSISAHAVLALLIIAVVLAVREFFR